MNRIIKNNFTGGLLSEVLWGRTDLNKYNYGLEECTNFIPQPYGGLKSRPGMKYIGDLDDLVDTDNCRLIPFVFNFVQSYILVFTDKKMRVIKDGGFVVYPAGDPNEGEVVEITTPYAESQLHNLRHTQITDTMYITHPEYERKKLVRTDHHDWSFNSISADAIDPPVITAVVGDEGDSDSTRLYIYFVTSVRADGLETIVDFSSGTPGILQEVYVTSPWPAGKTVGLAWLAEPDAEFYRVYKWSGTGYGLVAETEGTSFNDDNIHPSNSRGYVKPSATIDAEDEYPLAVGLFQQRLFYGGSNNNPQSFRASQTALLDNFSVSSYPRDTDAINFTLFSELSERILHFAAMEKLFAFTSESVKIIDSGMNSDAVTPTSINIRTRTRFGCSDVRPQVIGGDILFVHREGQKIYNMFYSLEADGFDTNELTMLVPDLLEDDAVLDWAWDSSRSILWIVTENHKLCSLTYDRRQQVWAWAKHETDGDVLSVGHIGGRNGSSTYIATQRTKVVAGIETDTFQVEQIYEGDRTDPKTCFCVDSGLTYSGVATDTVSGLDHLVGREVVILADGGVEPPQTVAADGSISLSAEAENITVGLGFTCVARPTRLNISSGATTIQNMPKLISRVALRLINTRGISVSTPVDSRSLPIELKSRSTEAYGEPSRLFSGDAIISTFGSWSRDGYLEIRQSNPLPAHITAMIMEVELED